MPGDAAIGDDPRVHVDPSGDISYSTRSMARPPLLAGGAHRKAACATSGPALVTKFWGAVGTVQDDDITLLDGLLPTALTARIRNEHVPVAGAPQVATWDSASAGNTAGWLHVEPESDDHSTVYAVMGLPPLEDGAVHLRVIDDVCGPAATALSVGALGTDTAPHATDGIARSAHTSPMAPPTRALVRARRGAPCPCLPMTGPYRFRTFGSS